VGIKRIPDELTAGAYITTDMADNQITGFNPGAMKYPSQHKLDGVDPLESLAIVCPGNTEDMVNYSLMYNQLKIPYICDPGQQITSLSGEELMEMVTGSELLIANDYELEMVNQKTGLGRDELLKRTKAAISTLGESGSLVLTTEGSVNISAVRATRVVDPTGAGDAYRAGLIKGMVLGKSLEDAARIGSTCASYAVENHGTQEHSFTEEEFWTRHEAAFGASH
jgi:adenosine kinase